MMSHSVHTKRNSSRFTISSRGFALYNYAPVELRVALSSTSLRVESYGSCGEVGGIHAYWFRTLVKTPVNMPPQSYLRHIDILPLTKNLFNFIFSVCGRKDAVRNNFMSVELQRLADSSVKFS